jgi:hypothetical protein
MIVRWPILLLGFLVAFPAAAQTEPSPADDDQALAKQLANPIANLISVPFQLNFDHDIGLEDSGERLTLNIQPVVPMSLSEDWNLISRTILPVTYQNDVVPNAGDQFGLGDTVQSFFFSPTEPGPGGVIWGVGPVFLLPTATDDLLGAEQWGIGPTGVALRQSGPWTYGVLANHLWSFAGADNRPDVNTTFLQPFLNYTTPGATTFFLNTEATYDWEDEAWSVPVHLGVNQLLTLGAQRIQIGGGLRYWAESPDGGPEGLSVRTVVTFLFPR